MHTSNLEVFKSKSDVILIVPEYKKDIAGRLTTNETQALALKVPREGPGQTSILQKTSPKNLMDLSVDVIDYNDNGQLSISGKAPPDSKLNIYLSNQFISQNTTSRKGKWQLDLKKSVEPGLYTLRVDQINNKGKVISRISMPFTRSKKITAMESGNFITVQPGNSLWRIARKNYGYGV